MTKAIVVRIEGDYVITAQGAGLLSTLASQASDARDEAVSAAAVALAAAGVGEYPDTGAGLSGTTEGETFWVDLGDGTGQVYRHDPGPTATPLHKFIIDPTDSGAADIFAGGVPTTAALASSSGADMVGTVGGGTVQSSLTTLETQTKVDAVDHRLRTGDDVAPHHVTGGSRTISGATLDGKGLVAVGAKILTGPGIDATFSTFQGYLTAENADKIYCCEGFGLRNQQAMADGVYVASFGTDSAKDVISGSNSALFGGKTALHVTSLSAASLFGTSAGAGGGAIESSVIVGASAADNNGASSGRSLIKRAVIIGEYAARGAQGDMLSTIIGNGAAQIGAFTGQFWTIIGHGAMGNAPTTSLGVAVGYGAGSNHNYSTSIGASSSAGFSGSTALGYNAACTKGNQVMLGGANVVETFLRGVIAATTYTYATLPSPSTSGAGARSFITDCNTTTFGAAAAGGGSDAVPVWSDGTSWRVG